MTHYDSLLDGELGSLRGDTYAASKFFEAAVVYAGRRGLVQDQALAHERYAEHLWRLKGGHGSDANFHRREAIKLFEEWGAHAKVERLRKDFKKGELAATALGLSSSLAPPTSIEFEFDAE